MKNPSSDISQPFHADKAVDWMVRPSLVIGQWRDQKGEEIVNNSLCRDVQIRTFILPKTGG